MAEPSLRLSQLSKRFGQFQAVKEIDHAIEEGEFFTIVGPSGSGKTPVVRMLAGL